MFLTEVNTKKDQSTQYITQIRTFVYSMQCDHSISAKIWFWEWFGRFTLVQIKSTECAVDICINLPKKAEVYT